MKTLITIAAVLAALVTVLGTRLLIPALEMVYYSILKSFEPVVPEPQPALAAVPTAVVVSEEAAPKPRPARRTRSKKATTIARSGDVKSA